MNSPTLDFFLGSPDPGGYLKPRLPECAALVTEEIHGCATDFLIQQKYDPVTKSITLTVTTVLPAFAVSGDHVAVRPPPRYPWPEIPPSHAARPGAG